MQTLLSICILFSSNSTSQLLVDLLNQEGDGSFQGYRYTIHSFQLVEEFLQYVEQEKHRLDCLILEEGQYATEAINYFRNQAILLPTVIVEPEKSTHETIDPYHEAMIRVDTGHLSQIQDYIDRAIAQFLQLSLSCNLQGTDNRAELLLQQQRRLSEKLKERLGYLGVYYKRNPKNFLRHLPAKEKKQFLDYLNLSYREIILSYFTEDNSVNQKIDAFVNTAFLADVSVSQIMEIHMELMSEFSKQLKLEGRSEGILLDYRLTLIDTIAHLCEMYRRSIPREA